MELAGERGAEGEALVADTGSFSFLSFLLSFLNLSNFSDLSEGPGEDPVPFVFTVGCPGPSFVATGDALPDAEGA